MLKIFRIQKGSAEARWAEAVDGCWGENCCTLFWGDKPPKGVTVVTFSKCILFDKESNREMHVQTFVYSALFWIWDLVNDCAEKVCVLFIYIYIPLYISLLKM